MQTNRNAPTTSGEADGGIDVETNSDAGSKLLAIGVRPSIVVAAANAMVAAGGGVGAGATLVGWAAGETWTNGLVAVSPAPRQPATTSARAKIEHMRRVELFLRKMRSKSLPHLWSRVAISLQAQTGTRSPAGRALNKNCISVFYPLRDKLL